MLRASKLVFWCMVIVASCQSDVNVTLLDCGMRRMALQYAQKLHSWRSQDDAVFAQIHDALQLSNLCGEMPHLLTDAPSVQSSRKLHNNKHLLHVCSKRKHCLHVSPQPASLFDGKPDGSIEKPFSSLHEALNRSRFLNESSETAIVLRQGVHELRSSIKFQPQDSGLTILGHPGENAYISGGISIPQHLWKPWHSNSTIVVANLTTLLKNYNLPKVASVFASNDGFPRYTRARYPNSNPEVDQWGYASPYKNLYSIPAHVVKEWHKPPKGDSPNFTLYKLAKNDSAMPEYNVYASGSGGVCATLWGHDADSYWCSNSSAGGWAEVDQECAVKGQLQIPIGMSYNSSDPIVDRFRRWKQGAVGAIVHAWHSQSWSMHMFEIESHNENIFRFAPGGGKQGGRNWCRCDQCTYAGPWCGQHQDPPDNTDERLISGTWLVENVLQELDVPGEFYFDHKTKLLYLMPNATTTTNHGFEEDVYLALLDNFFTFQNVSDVTITNVGFRHSAPTFMSDWSAPSGGDWALHRGGVVYIENAERIHVRKCSFSRLDGNAIFLSGRTRNVTIERSVFDWLGENAIATWGDTKAYDATEGNFPMYTRIEGNVMRELGIYQKQSSAVGQSKAALTFVRNNIMFNMPRAAINYNDGLGGGDVVQQNLIFNTCRESGDHGPINSWDRQPFLTTLRDGTTGSFVPLVRDLSRNFMFANYGASQAVDNDDGSSWFHIHDNVLYAAEGFKMDYGGHDSKFEHNLVMAYPYDGQQCVSMATFLDGHGHSAQGNTCIVGLGKHNIGSGCGDPSCANPQPEPPESLELVVSLGRCNRSNVHLAKNSYFTPNGTANFHCADDDSSYQTGLSLSDMQKLYQLEMGSKYGKTPAVQTMIQWASDILFGAS